MTAFRYRAYDRSGSLVEGEVDAASSSDALSILYQRGLSAFETRPAGHSKSVLERDVFRVRNIRAAATDLMREIATLLGAQIPVDEALALISTTSRKERGKVAGALLHSVKAGAPLSKALAAQPETFSPLHVALMRAGEASGSISAAAAQIADLMERNRKNRAKLVSALIYPSILLLVAVGVVILIATVLVPNLSPLFSRAGAAMPMSIRMLVGFSNIVTGYWPVLIGLAAAGWAGVGYALRKQTIKISFDRALLRTPVLGALFRSMETARFTHALSVLISAGVPMTQALEISSRTASNLAFRAQIEKTLAAVRGGGSFGGSLGKSGAVPDMAKRMILIGERSGRLGEMLAHVAQTLDANSQRAIERFVTILTPVLTLAIGLMVGGLIATVLSAILDANDLVFA